MCPYRKHHGCWFGHDDDLEDVSPCRDVAATSALSPAYGYTPVFVGLEAEPGVPVKQVLEEIVDSVGQWEKNVDDPVPLRSLDAELGDRFLQVLEQIVEVLKVLPEQIASQLKGWVYEERISERSGVQTVDLPVPQVMESVELQLECVAEQFVDLPVPQILGDVLQHVPERVQNCVGEQIGTVPVPQIWDQFLGERVQNRTPEPTMEFPVPQIMEDRMQNRTLDQISEFPLPRIMEAVVEVVPSTPQDSVQNRVEEQIADSPVPLFMEAAVEIVPSAPQVRVQNRTHEQMKLCRLHHMRACRITSGSRLWIPCLGS